jgi:glycerophosphoryl diester phosphodiesterase
MTKRKFSEVGMVCHRGANRVAPENTLAAGKPCIDWGARYIEVDVRTSKDGIFYILHDPTVDRTTNGSGRLRDLCSEEIDRLDAGSWFAPQFTGEPLPRLETYLQWIRGKAGVFFDVKDADLSTLIEMTHRIGIEEDSFFWFDNESDAMKFRSLSPNLAMKINATTVQDIERAIADYNAQIIEINLDCLSPEIVSACHSREVALMALVTENDPVAFRSVIEEGLDLINLDFPDVFRSLQQSLGKETGDL